MDPKHFWTWVLAHPNECSEVLIGIGMALSMITAALPKSAQHRPWVGPLVKFCARFGALTHKDEPGTLKWPLVLKAARQAAAEQAASEQAQPALARVSTPPPGAALVLLCIGLLGMSTGLYGCASLPPAEGCTPRATRCSPTGRPQVCSQSTRWTNASEVACITVGAVCCAATDNDGHPTHACVPSSACGDAGQ